MTPTRRRTAVLLATWFGSGLIPPIFVKGMAGTYGSIAALPLCWFVIRVCWTHELVGTLLYVLAVSVVTVAGVACIPVAELALGPRKDWKGKIKTRDQNQIVIDEVLGMLVACLPIILQPRLPAVSFAVALVAFRVFDTVKPWPANYFDRQKTAASVMLDDWAAGWYAAAVVGLVDYLLR